MKTAVVCDTGSGFTRNELEKNGVYFLPLQYNFNNESKLDGVEMSASEVYEKMKEGTLFSTSLTPVGLTEELFTKLKEEGYEEILGFPITAGLSSNAQTWEMVAEQVGIKYITIDCCMPAMIQGYLAMQAKKYLDQGKNSEEIKTYFEDIIKDAQTMIVPNDMEHLARSGRLTKLAASLANLLKIKPILQLNIESAGKVDIYDKVRTEKKAFIKMLDYAKEHILNKGEGYVICVADSLAKEKGEAVFNYLHSIFPKAEMHYELLVGVVGVHTGLDCVGIQYFKKPKQEL